MRPLANVDARTIEALNSAVGNAHDTAARIRRELPDYDGAPDAPVRRTAAGMTEADAVEWERDAELIHDLLLQSGWVIR